MKKTHIAVLWFLVVSMFMLSSCVNTTTNDNLWKTATYTEDTELGTGDKLIVVQVFAEDKSIDFRINTDCDILCDALLEHGLIDGEEDQYGLYVKEVNGIIADYDINKSYWSLENNGEYMQTGVSLTKINDGDHYEFIYTK